MLLGFWNPGGLWDQLFSNSEQNSFEPQNIGGIFQHSTLYTKDLTYSQKLSGLEP